VIGGAAVTIGELLREGPVIPVIVIEDARLSVPLARALVEGGVRVLEITLRTEAALESIRRIAREVPEAIVGVGTITQPQQFGGAREAGARFAVTPGFTQDLAWAARESRLPLLPGVMTPSDVIAAVNAGFRELKLFPARQAGGVGMLKALAGPFPNVRFCPTGGITAKTVPEYLALSNVACVGGSWLTPGEVIKRHDWASVTTLARQAAALRPVLIASA
jgi:2-dehydro-3-deoxyphosphogluconate aldolase / (4S)-4-hydroxy-2-oxoglutarate aldolase